MFLSTLVQVLFYTWVLQGFISYLNISYYFKILLQIWFINIHYFQIVYFFYQIPFFFRKIYYHIINLVLWYLQISPVLLILTGKWISYQNSNVNLLSNPWMSFFSPKIYNSSSMASILISNTNTLILIFVIFIRRSFFQLINFLPREYSHLDSKIREPETN